MHDGDLAIVEKKAAYHIGDVIAYHVPAGQPGFGSNIIHRIVAGDARSGFVTKGDHNGYTDLWHPRPSDVIGKVWVHIRWGSLWLDKLRQPLDLAIAVGVTTFLLVAWPSRRKKRADTPLSGRLEPITSPPA